MPSKPKGTDKSGSRHSSSTRGGTSEQHAEAGRQSHKNDPQKGSVQGGSAKKKPLQAAAVAVDLNSSLANLI